MSVKECRRKDCTNIMCNRHSHRYGYICHECFKELRYSHMSIAMFMAIAKNDLPNYNYAEEFKEEG